MAANGPEAKLDGVGMAAMSWVAVAVYLGSSHDAKKVEDATVWALYRVYRNAQTSY